MQVRSPVGPPILAASQRSCWLSSRVGSAASFKHDKPAQVERDLVLLVDHTRTESLLPAICIAYEPSILVRGSIAGFESARLLGRKDVSMIGSIGGTEVDGWNAAREVIKARRPRREPQRAEVSLRTTEPSDQDCGHRGGHGRSTLRLLDQIADNFSCLGR